MNTWPTLDPSDVLGSALIWQQGVVPAAGRVAHTDFKPCLSSPQLSERLASPVRVMLLLQAAEASVPVPGPVVCAA